MSSSFQDLVAAQLPFDGLAAYAAQLSDGSTAGECWASWLKPDQWQQTLAQLVAAVDSLPGPERRPVQLCWTFEQLRFYLALRSDGGSLALLVENRPEVDPRLAESVLAEFFTQPDHGGS